MPLVINALVRAAAGMADQVPGLMTYNEVMTLAALGLAAESVVEIGCYKGRSTTALALTGNTVFSVDNFSQQFDGDAAEEVFNEFRKTQRKLAGRSVLLRMTSQTDMFVECLRPIYPGGMGAAFIDGNHDYKHVTWDIEKCRLVVKKGGLICGHDYNMDGVKMAVQEAFGSKVMLPSGAGPDNKMWWAVNE